MNEDFLQFKEKLQHRTEILQESITELEGLKLAQGASAQRWRDHLLQVQGALEDTLLRVAVVGAVKSGKSTLINALIGRDLLKRGAGILTSFVTRIQTDGEPGGWVELKPWDQILEEINAALRLTPVHEEDQADERYFDIRDIDDREKLQSLVDRMQSEWQQTRGGLDPGFLLLKSYLAAYNGLSANMGDSVNRLIFDEQSLPCHQRYVGHDAEAVYVRDIELHCPTPWLGGRIEIADCQGCDSPNPIHLELLQQYLLRCHLIIYVVSSRMGLRDADFKLLQFIKTLRMFPQTFFVLNADFDAHERGDDVEKLHDRVRTELSWVVPNPQVFTFSALYHLLEVLGESAWEREGRRFTMWKEDAALSQYTERGFMSFREHIANRIVGQRTRILLGSGLSRLSMVANSMLDTASTQKRFMDQDLETLQKSLALLEERQKSLDGTLKTLNNSILGLRNSLMTEIDSDVGRAFDPVEGFIAREILNMVENYPINPEEHRDLADPRQVFRRLYLFYLEFRQALSRHIVERVNLRVIEFAKEQEGRLQDRLGQSSRDLWSLFETAVQNYRLELAENRLETCADAEIRDCELPMAERTAVPSFSAFVDKGRIGRGILLMKFSLGRVTRFLSDLKTRIGKGSGSPEREDNDVVREIIELVKSETKAELIEAFKEYRTDFQFGYLFRLLDSGTQHLMDEFRDRTDMTRLDFVGIKEQSEKEGEARETAVQTLTKTILILEAMMEELEELRCSVNLEWLPDVKNTNRGEEAPL